MKLIKTTVLLSATFMVSLLNANGQDKSTKWNGSVLEIGLGTKSYSDVPDDVFVQYDTIYDNLDLGKGKPVLLTLGFVMMPETNGFGGRFAFDGVLGKQYGIDIELAAGYKIGNDRLSFMPTVGIGFGRLWSHMGSYTLDSNGIFASQYDSGSQAIYVGSSQNIGGGSGSNINYTVSNAFLELKLNADLIFNLTDKYAIFGRLGYNIQLANSKSDFKASGRGYENFNDLVAAANSEDMPPVSISTDISSSGFMQQGGKDIDKIPINMSGVQIQFGIAIRAGK